VLASAVLLQQWPSLRLSWLPPIVIYHHDDDDDENFSQLSLPFLSLFICFELVASAVVPWLDLFVDEIMASTF
jgi:hypothetical protein